MGFKTPISTAGIFGLSLLFMGCPKECISPERAYQAVHQIMSHDSVSIGDTLWLKSEMDCKSMHNNITSNSDTFCGVKFSFTLGMVKYENPDSNYIATGAVEYFSYVNDQGRIWNSKDIPSPETVNQVEFEMEGDKYVLRVGFIPLKRGYYTIAVGNGGSFEGRHCDRAKLSSKIDPNFSNMDLFIKVNNNRDFTGEDLSSFFCFEVQ